MTTTFAIAIRHSPVPFPQNGMSNQHPFWPIEKFIRIFSGVLSQVDGRAFGANVALKRTCIVHTQTLAQTQFTIENENV